LSLFLAAFFLAPSACGDKIRGPDGTLKE